MQMQTFCLFLRSMMGATNSAPWTIAGLCMTLSAHDYTEHPSSRNCCLFAGVSCFYLTIHRGVLLYVNHVIWIHLGWIASGDMDTYSPGIFIPEHDGEDPEERLGMSTGRVSPPSESRSNRETLFLLASQKGKKEKSA